MVGEFFMEKFVRGAAELCSEDELRALFSDTDAPTISDMEEFEWRALTAALECGNLCAATFLVKEYDIPRLVLLQKMLGSTKAAQHASIFQHLWQFFYFTRACVV